MKMMIFDGGEACALASDQVRLVGCERGGRMLTVYRVGGGGGVYYMFSGEADSEADAMQAEVTIPAMAMEAAALPGCYLAVGNDGKKYELCRVVEDDAGVSHKVLREYEIEAAE